MNEPERKDDGEWERDVLNRLAFASLNEQRRTRRWGIFFKGLSFAFVLLVFFSVVLPGAGVGTDKPTGPHVAVVNVDGVISGDSVASADAVVGALRSAMENRDSRGVILRVNSPGGSPVQAGYIFDEMMRLREEYPEKPLHAVITDVGASGGYYIAAGAENIYANRSSVVGSIGVTLNPFSPLSFGFHEALENMGIERRLITSGDSKALLDPFMPAREDQVAHMQGVLDEMHTQFIDAVRAGRGERLNGDEAELFSGLIWTGERGLELGLVDGLASTSQVAREVFEQERLVDYTRRPSPLERFVERLGVALARGVGQVFGASNFAY